jgi:type II secretory pathway pseudopilin PulG
MKRTSGLTLVEMLIILTVIGVIGAVTIPKFHQKLIQAREARTKSNLADLRGALAIYFSDNNGKYPPDDGTPETRLKDFFIPRYLKSIPKVELPHLHKESLTTIDIAPGDGGNWFYQKEDGFVGVNCTHKDSKGEDISNW